MSGPKQSSRAALIEAVVNTFVGLVIAFVMQLLFLKATGVDVPIWATSLFAAGMTVVSVGRGWALRRIFEALHIRTPLSPGVLAIIAERGRQESVEGWTAQHDDEYPPGVLAAAGAAYAIAAFEARARSEADGPPDCWPLALTWWKPRDARRNLARAGALVLAELDKLDRTKIAKVKTS